jgi:hypothetical protein
LERDGVLGGRASWDAQIKLIEMVRGIGYLTIGRIKAGEVLATAGDMSRNDVELVVNSLVAMIRSTGIRGIDAVKVVDVLALYIPNEAKFLEDDLSYILGMFSMRRCNTLFRLSVWRFLDGLIMKKAPLPESVISEIRNYCSEDEHAKDLYVKLFLQGYLQDESLMRYVDFLTRDYLDEKIRQQVLEYLLMVIQNKDPRTPQLMEAMIRESNSSVKYGMVISEIFSKMSIEILRGMIQDNRSFELVVDVCELTGRRCYLTDTTFFFGDDEQEIVIPRETWMDHRKFVRPLPLITKRSLRESTSSTEHASSSAISCRFFSNCCLSVTNNRLRYKICSAS